jgi:sugar phosphate isomerase/epimerase
VESAPFAVAGKCEPSHESFEHLHDAGFAAFELYLDTPTLRDRGVTDVVAECRASPGEVVAVHTPHVALDGTDADRRFEQADEVAAELGAALVFDANPTSTRYAPNLYPDGRVRAPAHGYENDPSVSAFYLETTHLGGGRPLVLDTAHLHMSEATYLPFVERVLATHADRVPVVHLADGTRVDDGLPFGEGTVPLADVLGLLEAYDYDGVVTLEAPRSAQPDALAFCERVLGERGADRTGRDRRARRSGTPAGN